MSSNKTLYFSCGSGISGDMTVAALLDLGLDHDEYRRQLDGLDLDGYAVEIGKREVGAVSACDFLVRITDHQHVHRNLNDIEQIISASRLSADVQELSRRIFHRLAEAEARVHGVSIDEIHFHEVGAVDSIVDIVSAAICVCMINPDRVVFSELPFGTGQTKCAHGLLPVPVPATVEILKGAAVYQTEIRSELITPTGAAIARTIADDFGPLPPMELQEVGYGAGKKQLEIPNMLRVFLGTDAPAGRGRAEQEIAVLETNIDDMNPEIYSYLVPLLMDRGALDVYLTNVMMKKGRPGVLLTVLCDVPRLTDMEDLLFSETTTLGVRHRLMRRHCLDREAVTVKTSLGPVKAKTVYRKGKPLRISPEYEACRRIASERGLPIQDVYETVHREITESHMNRTTSE